MERICQRNGISLKYNGQTGAMYIGSDGAVCHYYMYTCMLYVLIPSYHDGDACKNVSI